MINIDIVNNKVKCIKINKDVDIAVCTDCGYNVGMDGSINNAAIICRGYNEGDILTDIHFSKNEVLLTSESYDETLEMSDEDIDSTRVALHVLVRAICFLNMIKDAVNTINKYDVMGVIYVKMGNIRAFEVKKDDKGITYKFLNDELLGSIDRKAQLKAISALMLVYKNNISDILRLDISAL